MLNYKGLTEEEIQELIDNEVKIRNKIKETWITMNDLYQEWLLKESKRING